MRILIFTTAYLPFVGGAELAIKEITDRLSPVEFSFDLITLNLDGKQKKEERVGNVRVTRLSCPKILFPFAAFMRASNVHRKEPYTHVWSVMASYGGFAGLFFKHHFPKVPFILTLQEGDSFSHIYRRVFFIWPLFKMIFTRADRITAISNYLAEWAKRMGARCPIEVIPNGFDAVWFDKNQTPLPLGNRERFKSMQEFRNGDKILITTSRLVHKNAIDIVIKALKYLATSIHFLILGDGPLRSDLESLAKQLKLSERVHFAEQVPNTTIIQYLNISDIFVRPSRSEGFGTSFVEAMAAGVPVVATPVGGIPDFLKDGETGLFCTVDDPEDLARKVTQLLENEQLRKRLMSNASKVVREKYEWSRIVEKMRSVLTGM